VAYSRLVMSLLGRIEDGTSALREPRVGPLLPRIQKKRSWISLTNSIRVPEDLTDDALDWRMHISAGSLDRPRTPLQRARLKQADAITTSRALSERLSCAQKVRQRSNNWSGLVCSL
jgi:hypothetical protein